MSRFDQRVRAALRNPEVAAGYAAAQAERDAEDAEHCNGQGRGREDEQRADGATVAPRTYLSAALEVLRTAAGPLTSDEITDEALRRGMLVTVGKTPRRTMAACLYTLVKNEPNAPIVRTFTPGTGRARRGSVRWQLRTAPRLGDCVS